ASEATISMPSTVIFSFQDRQVVGLGGHVEDGVVDVTAMAAYASVIRVRSLWKRDGKSAATQSAGVAGVARRVLGRVGGASGRCRRRVAGCVLAPGSGVPA